MVNAVSLLEDFAHPGEKESIDSLTLRKLEILGLICNGDSNQEIAEKLSLTPKSIETSIGQIYSALGISGNLDFAYRTRAAVLYKSHFPVELIVRHYEMTGVPTKREVEVLSLVAQGYSNERIAK